MQSILLSMRPNRCEKVVNEQLTLDVRKTRVNIETPFKVYIYCTKPRRVKSNIVKVGHVIGEFICRKMHFFPFMEMFVPPDWEVSLGNQYYITCGQLDRTGMSYEELCKYGAEKHLYGLEISDLRIYDDPMKLSEFCYAGAPNMEDLDEELCNHCAATEYGEHREYHTPNGVYMCEGSHCGEAYEAFLEEEYSIFYPPRSFCRVEVI